MMNNKKENGNSFENHPEFLENTEEYQKIWNLSKEIDFPEFDENAALIKMHHKIRQHHLKISWPKLAGIAATIVLIIALSILLLFQNNSKNIQYIEITVKKGERLNINLPDGNKVWLNSNTRIKYPANFTGFNRRIEVIGEAFFEIKNNNEYPIMIASGDLLINCEIASFNLKSIIHAEKFHTQITVEKGNVILSNNIIPSGTTVESGYLATLSSELPLFIEQNINVNFNSWKTGILNFNNTPLGFVARDIENTYGISVILKGPIKYCEFNSKYQNVNITTILNDIKNSFDAVIVQKNDQIIISGNHCI